MARFIQWNCSGYYPNFEELTSLIDLHNPMVICLQEMQLRGREFLQPFGYKPVLISLHHGVNDCGTVILFNESIPLTPVPLRTHLHAVTTCVHLDSLLTVCYIYLVPRCQYSKGNLFTIFTTPEWMI